MSRTVHHMFAVFCEKPAGCSALSRAHKFWLKHISRFLREFPYIDLIAHNTLFRVRFLEYKVFPVETEIRFRIITAEAELLDIFQMSLLRISERINSSWDREAHAFGGFIGTHDTQYHYTDQKMQFHIFLIGPQNSVFHEYRCQTIVTLNLCILAG
jgi:hypothetical protein